jgi:peptide/nickel transport system substrate-binding protein
MDEQALRGLIAKVKVGNLSRRAFVQRMVALGLTAPMASQMLNYCDVAQARAKFVYVPTKRGGGGALRLLWWQSPTLLNPHFAVGTKDQEGSRIFYEPLAAWDADGDLKPVLAAEIPSRENGGLAADGLSVSWKLKQSVKWHDGKPFTELSERSVSPLASPYEHVEFDSSVQTENDALTISIANTASVRGIILWTENGTMMRGARHMSS